MDYTTFGILTLTGFSACAEFGSNQPFLQCRLSQDGQIAHVPMPIRTRGSVCSQIEWILWRFGIWDLGFKISHAGNLLRAETC
jgi:hypothetical protein